MLKTNYILSLTLLVSIPVCAMERPPHLNNAKPAALPKVVLKTAVKPAPAVANTKSTCNVCFDDKTALDTRTLACGHTFCLDCLRSNIQTAVKDKQTQALKCFDPKCKRPIDITDLRKIVYDKNTHNQINELQLQQWLKGQENIKNCPTTNCHFSFVNERADQFTHKCPDCNQEYCGKCLHKHTPAVSCTQAEQDRNLTQDKDAQARATREWELAHTKQCPRCKAKTEKTVGCNHMTCANCQYHYCWNCVGPWDHASYSCKNQCGVSTFENTQPRAQQPQQQEMQLTLQNMHVHFARDPRGFVNIVRNRHALQVNITLEFAERFMHFSCEDQGRWSARINQIMQRDQWGYYNDLQRHWNTELERLEPFTFRVNNYRGTAEGSSIATIGMNRELNARLANQIQEWISKQNPQDMFIFNGWNCETSISQDRLQEILNQAIAHFRNQILNQPRPAPRVLEVRNSMIYMRNDVTVQQANPYLEYIRDFVTQNYRRQYGTQLNGNGILVWEISTGALATAQTLQRLVDEAHNHFAMQNQ